VVSSNQPFSSAIRVSDSSGIHFRNVHVNSNSKVAFDNSIVDAACTLWRRRSTTSLSEPSTPT
jgi:hypothetical protein